MTNEPSSSSAALDAPAHQPTPAPGAGAATTGSPTPGRGTVSSAVTIAPTQPCMSDTATDAGPVPIGRVLRCVHGDSTRHPALEPGHRLGELRTLGRPYR